MYYEGFHNLTPWAPSDYLNTVIPPHNLHSVHHDFNIRKLLCRTNIFANDFLTGASLHGIVCLVLSSIQSLLLRLSVLLYQLICPNFSSLCCLVLLFVQSVILHVNLILVSH